MREGMNDPHVGRIIRKKNRGPKLVIAVKGTDDEIATNYSIDRSLVNSMFNFLFLNAIVSISDGEGDNPPEIQLIASAPIPEAVNRAIDDIYQGRLDVSVVACSSVHDLEKLCNEYTRRSVVEKLIRRLLNQEERKGPRKRTPHLSKKDIAFLNQLELEGKNEQKFANAQWQLLQPKQRGVPTDDHSSTTNVYNLPSQLEKDQERRIEYLTGKKEYQILWMLNRMRQLLHDSKDYFHVIDVGGGRGDLACRIALEFPQLYVTVIDINETSLKGGREYARSMRIGEDRMQFLHSDFATFLSDTNQLDKRVDLVVALHACGDLTDLALKFSQQHGCDFMVCPCCYTKRYNTATITPVWCQLVNKGTKEQSDFTPSSQTLGRLAETDGSPDISSKARIIINSMRLYGIHTTSYQNEEKYELSLEEYSSKTSLRNLVLIGTKKRRVPPKEEEEPIEEDWSDIMTSDLSGGFAQHKKEEIQLTNNLTLQIASVSSLTPLDMIDLSWGTHDATGHCIWTGARLFTQLLIPKLQPYFCDRRVLELGCGTGLAAIALSKLLSTEALVATDVSESALDLCSQNCNMNQIKNIQIEKLCWGETLDSEQPFDTVLATDVLYDIQAWEPLLRTANASLKTDGVFVLSHVPRAALPEGETESIESYLINIANKKYHFQVLETFKPQNVPDLLADRIQMEQAGAAIFIFRKGKAN